MLAVPPGHGGGGGGGTNNGSTTDLSAARPRITDVDVARWHLRPADSGPTSHRPVVEFEPAGGKHPYPARHRGVDSTWCAARGCQCARRSDGRAVSSIVRENLHGDEALESVQAHSEGFSSRDSETFRRVVKEELAALHEGNFARYRLRPSEFEQWRAGRET